MIVRNRTKRAVAQETNGIYSAEFHLPWRIGVGPCHPQLDNMRISRKS